MKADIRAYLELTGAMVLVGKPADVYDAFEAWGEWLHETELPKLLVYAETRVFTPLDVARRYAEELTNTTAVGFG